MLPTCVDQRAYLLDRIMDDLAQVNRSRFQLDQAPVNTRNVKQMIDQSGHVPDLPADDVAGLPQLVATELALSEQVGRDAYWRQRIAQLMGQHRQKLIFSLASFLKVFSGKLLLVDIGAGTYPASDCSGLAAHRQRPAQRPAVLARPVTQPVLDLIGLASVQAVAPDLPGLVLVFGVEHAVPIVAVGRALAAPR